MTIVVSNNVTNVQVSDSAAARADRILAEAAAAAATGAVSPSALTRITSISSLRAQAVDTGKSILLTGYYSSGDGGGGEFYGVSGGTYTDDGGKTIVPGGGTGSSAWIRIIEEFATPEMFGAKGDNATDDTTSLQAMFSAYNTIRFPGTSKTYVVSSKITIQSGTSISGDFASIKQTSSNTEILYLKDLSDVSISGVTFIGKGTDRYVNDNNRATAIYCDDTTPGCTRIKIINNKFYNFTYAAIRGNYCHYIEVCDNYIQQPKDSPYIQPDDGVPYGILFDHGDHGIISNNEVYYGAQGLRIEKFEKLDIVGNLIEGVVGQHGMYIGSNCSNLVVSSNLVYNCYYHGIKVQASDLVSAVPNTDIKNITITSNTIVNVGSQGIVINNGTYSPNKQAINRLYNVSITGNSIYNTSNSGIVLQHGIACTITGNTISTCAQSGIVLRYNDYLTVANNTIKTTSLEGVIINACTYANISGNLISDAAQANSAGYNFGIVAAGGVANDGSTTLYSTNLSLYSNLIYDANAKMAYGIYLDTNVTQSTCLIYDNYVQTATSYGIKFNGTDSLVKYGKNVFNGTSGPASNSTTIPSVASASTISLPMGYDVITVTGTTGISTITANGQTGRTVTLVFSGVLTVSRTSSILLNQSAGSFTTSSSDTLTLCCDGTTWFEIARSVN